MIDFLATFDRGAFLLDWRGRILRMNAKAEATMGPGIGVRAGMLTAGDGDCDAALQKLIASVIARGPLHRARSPLPGRAHALSSSMGRRLPDRRKTCSSKQGRS
jgi:hypothetical protein